MTIIKKFQLIILILVGLIFASNSYAWSTRDFGDDGPHPELLPQSTCLYDANNYYQSGPYSESHSYSGKIGGFDIFGNGSGGANTSLGIGGTDFYETGNVKYFVGRFVEYVVIREVGGREAQRLPYYKYQICYVNSASFSYYGYNNSTSACPSSQPNGVIYTQQRYEVWTDGSIKNYTGWYETSRNCQAAFSYYGEEYSTSTCPATQPSGYIAIARLYEMWTDGSKRNYQAWRQTANYCQAIFSYYGEEYSTSACPATQPSGYIAIARLYEIWTDGSKRNYQAWRQTANYCQAVKQGTETGTQSLACSNYGAAYIEGGNGITQTRSREIWSDGARAWSGWVTTSNTCYKTVTDTQAQKTYSCAEGQIGKIVKEPRRTHIEYAADTTKTDAEKATLNEKNSTVWIDYVVSNTCTDVPSKNWQETKTSIVSCESVMGASYTGNITRITKTNYSYSSVTKQTTNTSTVQDDKTECANNSGDVTMESTTEACPTGQSGSITKYRYVSTNSSGVKTYPQGNAYQTLSNTCTGSAISSDTATNNNSVTQSSGLIENSSLKTSDISSIANFTNYLKNLNTANLEQSNYKLNLSVDNLSTSSNYNATNVSALVNTFNTTVAKSSGSSSNVVIGLPTDLSKYAGYGGITANNTTGKSFKSAVLNNDGSITVTYKNIGTSLKSQSESSFNVPLLKSVNTSNVTLE